MKKAGDLKHILCSSEVSGDAMAHSFLSISGAGSSIYAAEEELGESLNWLKGRGFNSKEVLILKNFKGRMFQKCPGTPGMICCNYSLLNTGFGCLYDCTYCFLNTYMNSFGITQFANVRGISGQIPGHILSDSSRVYRLGTGEFTDSLMYDEITGIAADIISDRQIPDHIIVEFKTKSDNIAHLLTPAIRKNMVLSWSLNTEKNISMYEKDTASLEERTIAAGKACESGYLTAFHFDPVILYEGCLEEYYEVIDRLFSAVDPDRVLWISIGGLRYTPDFLRVVRDRFSDEKMTAGELFPCSDGKYRYFKPQRIDFYRKLSGRIREYSGKIFIYLCMESSDVMYQSLGCEYEKPLDLELDLSGHLRSTFGF